MFLLIKKDENMADTKRQHYVPRFLLKHFCVDGRTINVTDLIEKRTYQANIMKVAQEKYFYNLNTNKGKVSLEKQYAGLEDKAAPIVDKIVKTESSSNMNKGRNHMLNIFTSFIIGYTGSNFSQRYHAQ